jgi:hypothetical protein
MSTIYVKRVLILAAISVGLAGHARGVEPRVSGIKDLVVIEPDLHEQGWPAVTLRNTPDGGLQVEIPPTIHVHRFYYSGDREYQGPVIKGGPTLIVAGHPRSGEQLYTRVTLPPGMPIIAYSQSAITYQYQKSRVRIRFPHNEDVAVIEYHDGRGWKRKISDARDKMAKKRMGREKKESPTLSSVKETLGEGKNMVTGAVKTVDESTATVFDAFKSVVQMIPGIKSLGGEAPEKPPKDPSSFRKRLEGTAP